MATEIESFRIDRLNAGAHVAFAESIANRAASDASVYGVFKAEIDAFGQAVENEKTTLGATLKAEQTDEISKADATRDGVYRGYCKAVSAFESIPETGHAAACQALQQHIKNYGIDVRMQLDRQTGLMTTFLEDLNTTMAPHIAYLGLGAFVAHMTAANDRVRELTEQRTEARMNQKAGTVKAVRNATSDAYEALVKCANAFVLLYGDESFKDFIAYVNTQIVHYKRESLK